MQGFFESQRFASLKSRKIIVSLRLTNCPWTFTVSGKFTCTLGHWSLVIAPTNKVSHLIGYIQYHLGCEFAIQFYQPLQCLLQGNQMCTILVI